MEYLTKEGIPVTVFLTTGTVTDWDYWRDMAAVGSIQNHSVSHAAFPGLGRAGQVREMCEASASIDDGTGEAPWMVRPPYGAFDDGTLAAAGQCGLDYVVQWTATMGSGRLQYQTAKGGLDRGDIILGHFTPDLARTLPAIVKQIRAEGFEVARLEDYLLPRGWKAPATATESRAYFVG
jgi:peptidoglycan/xylan/chitin deacetylase (PgdA/CDA1 family)